MIDCLACEYVLTQSLLAQHQLVARASASFASSKRSTFDYWKIGGDRTRKDHTLLLTLSGGLSSCSPYELRNPAFEVNFFSLFHRKFIRKLARSDVLRPAFFDTTIDADYVLYRGFFDLR